MSKKGFNAQFSSNFSKTCKQTWTRDQTRLHYCKNSPKSVWESCPGLCFIKEFEHSVDPEQPVDPDDDGAGYPLVT